MKTGRSSRFVLLGIPFGKGTIDAAVKRAGITKITDVEFRNHQLTRLLRRHTCIVKGT